MTTVTVIVDANSRAISFSRAVKQPPGLLKQRIKQKVRGEDQPLVEVTPASKPRTAHSGPSRPVGDRTVLIMVSYRCRIRPEHALGGE